MAEEAQTIVLAAKALATALQAAAGIVALPNEDA